MKGSGGTIRLRISDNILDEVTALDPDWVYRFCVAEICKRTPDRPTSGQMRLHWEAMAEMDAILNRIVKERK